MPEIIVSLIFLEKELGTFLISMNWLNVFSEVLKSLDKLNRFLSEIELYDADDMSWPGITHNKISHISHKLHEELPLIRKADVENHNLDGGRWVIVNNKVYDVQDFRCENPLVTELLKKHTGKDASHVLNSYPHKSQLLTLMENYIVGNYCQLECDMRQSNIDSLQICTMLLDAERNLGYLLGLHAYHLRQSLPLSQEEIKHAQWMKSSFLSGGLQVFFFICLHIFLYVFLFSWGYKP